MRGRWLPAALAALALCTLFGPVVWPDLGAPLPERNFIFRDAGHFYYPYFELIQQEWSAGRVPLWNPYENGGAPLAANPTASVFYPGKLLFFLFDYPFAYRWYLLGHIVLAYAAAAWAGRRMGLDPWPACAAGLAYAFGGFVVFQLYNIVFLCGAAWLPIALVAAHRTVHDPAPGWGLVLAASLALMVLAGDPEAAYFVGVAAAPLAAYVHFGLRRGTVLLAGFLSAGAALVQFERLRPLARVAYERGAPAALFAQAPVSIATAVIGLGVAAAILLSLARSADGAKILRRAFGPLFLAGFAAFLLSAVQVLPTMVFTRMTDRAALEAPHESIAFSLFPARLVELLFPAFFGRQLPMNARWAPFEAMETGIWVPTLYMGAATVVFAFAGAVRQWRRPGVAWLGGLTLLFLWASLGKFGGPLWLLKEDFGRPKPLAEGRATEKLYGEPDGLYGLAELVLPGMRSFRYPSKLLVFCCAGAALLAGFGVQSLAENAAGWPGKLAGILAALSLLLAAASLAAREPILAFFEGSSQRTAGSIYGPVDVGAAWTDLFGSLLHGGIVLGLLSALVWLRRRQTIAGPGGFSAATAVLIGADLVIAGSWLVLTDVQSAIDQTPLAVRVIEEEEKRDPSPGPFRVHRTRIFNPLHWLTTRDPDRMIDVSRWERETIQPKYAEPYGIQYAAVTGTMSLYDVEFFFAPWTVPTPPAVRQAAKEGPPRMVYFPRVGYNLWNARYFVLPKLLKLDDEDRGFFTLLTTAAGTPLPVLAESPATKDDFVILKNTEAFPRAWIVHRADFRRPIEGLRRQDRLQPMEQLLYRSLDAGMPLWKGIEHGDYPLRSAAMIETTDALALAHFAPGGAPSAEETVEFLDYRSDGMELKVSLEKPGFVVIADTYYPGWSARVDGAAAPILRANRAMRGIPVDAGEHRLVLRYRDRWFEAGAILSGIGWIAATMYLAAARARGFRPRSAGSEP